MANRPDALQSSRWSQCSSASVRTSWLYRPDAIQCLTSIRVSDSRHSYGKMAATVRTMCDPVRARFYIRQDVHTKFNHPDVRLHGLDDQASYMEIACTSSTVRTSAFKVRTLQALLWQFRVAKVQPSGCLGNTVRTRPCYGSFQCYFGKVVAVDHPDARSSRSDTLGYFGHNVLVKYRIGTKLASLES
jgi:hypothetical protein